MACTQTETLFDYNELLRSMKDHLVYWNSLYREQCETPERVMRNNCRVAIQSCIQDLEDELTRYEEHRPANAKPTEDAPPAGGKAQ